MRSSSSCEKVVFFNAPNTSSICETRLAPISAEVTTGRRSTQAMAICAIVCPRAWAISFNLRTLPMISSVTWSGLRKPCGLAARESAGISFR